MILQSLEIPIDELEALTGWAVKPEGACKGDVCVPLPNDAVHHGCISANVLEDRLGMPLLQDEDTGTWVLGPEVLGKALTTARAPDLVLPDAEGRPFDLSSLRGQKVLLIAWASW